MTSLIKIYKLFTFFAVSLCLFSCTNSDSYTTPPDKLPYPKLSDYDFFVGNMNELTPNEGLLPYEPASSLFSDYAHKKRFVWMPKNTQASYNGDYNVLEFPQGAILIKTFYYDQVQPNNTTQIIETRLLIRKSTGWFAYTYVWNADQTDAFLETTNNGIYVPITWKNEQGITKTVQYKVPSQTECLTCHKINPNHLSGGEKTIPIGPKPQNLNTTFAYATGAMNQLLKWKEVGYLSSDLPDLASIRSTVDWRDTSQSLEKRARSYIDINCAHCHREGGHCDYTPQRFNFSNTNINTFGVCLTPLFTIPNKPFVIAAGDADHSELIYRIDNSEPSEMMPIIGRSLIHTEGVQLMKDYINSLPRTCR
ncbi:MAG: hypothetical protein CFE24_11520 [Flavobacterium sp. BFFFF2]|nr:MAG: hypothetical protein CFE24_11520 [Flavobacterium sp. BFFFF2]